MYLAHAVWSLGLVNTSRTYTMWSCGQEPRHGMPLCLHNNIKKVNGTTVPEFASFFLLVEEICSNTYAFLYLTYDIL